MLDLLSKAINEAFEEIEILRKHRKKLKQQLTIMIENKKMLKDFEAKYNNLDYINSLNHAINISRVREYCWFKIVNNCSRKKNELCTENIYTKKILRRKLFEFHEIEGILQKLPIKNQLVEAKLKNRTKGGLKLELFDGFSSIVPQEEVSFFKGWRTGSNKYIFAKSVDYRNKSVQVDSVLTMLACQIDEVGIDKFKFQAVCKEEVLKNGIRMGILLEYLGKELFLPNSLMKNVSAIEKGEAYFRFVNESIHQYNLVVEQV